MNVEVDNLKINYKCMNFLFYRDGMPLNPKLTDYEMTFIISALLYDVVFAFDFVALNRGEEINQKKELVSLFERLGYGKLRK